MKKSIFVAVFLLFSFSIFSVSVSAGNYMNFYSSAVVQPGEKINFTGSVYNASNSNQIISNINVSAVVNNTVNTSATSAGSQINFTVNAPNAVGEYNVIIYSNDSSIMNKTFTVYVSNVTNGNISFVNAKPPFTGGQSFTINITLANYSAPVADYFPKLKIFAANGPENGSVTGWVIKNLSATSDGSGRIQYNITVPSAADGQYVIAVEYGMIYNIFTIKAGYSASGVTHQSGDDSQLSANYGIGDNVSLLVKVKDLNGNPVDTTNITGVIAYITYPNNTVTNITLGARDQTTYPGYFNNTFTTDSSQQGQYKVRYDINTTEGKIIQTYTIFNTKQLNVKIQSNKDFFMEWGGSASFRPNSNAVLNVIVTNMTDESMILNSSENTGGNLSCNNVSVTTFWNTSDNMQFYISNTTPSGNYLSNQICRISFTSPSKSGVYGVRVNVTVGSITETGEGYFAVQNYIVKGSISSELGGEGDFKTMVYPGDNTTVNIKAYNLNNNSDVAGLSIQNISVTKIVPLEFSGSITEITNVTYYVDYGAAPSIKVTVPESIMGPMVVEFRANISGEIVVGNVFFVSNYISGFLGPSKGSEFGGGEGQMMSFASCSAGSTLTFNGMVSDVKSGTPVSGVSVNSIILAREEMTGKSIASYINLTSSGTSDSSGMISVNFTILPGYDLQEFNFIAFNASYKGKTAGIPSGFMCKKYNFFPQISPAGKQEQSMRIAPGSGVTITIQNAQMLDGGAKLDNRTNISITRLMSFSPSKGGTSMLLPKAGTNNFLKNFTHNDTAGDYSNIVSNNVSITIYPQNFTLDGNNITSWPSGFVDLQPRVCGPLGCDTSFGGFETVAFDVWPSSWAWQSQVSAGQSVKLNISAKTNVSIAVGANNITVKVGRPWEGQLYTATLNRAALMDDRWNKSSDMDGEIWEINFTIPDALKKGFADITITVNNTNGETTDLHMGTQIAKYSVYIGAEEGIGDQQYSGMDGYFIDYNRTSQDNVTLSKYGGWNTTKLWEAFKINSTSGRVCVKLQFNTTRYGNTQTPVNYSAAGGTKIMILDNGTASYDTIILNSSGVLSVAKTNSLNPNIGRNMTQITASGALHIWKIEDCGYVKIVNSSASVYTQGQVNSWGGEYQVSTNFSIPYIIIANSLPKSGATVGINGLANQTGGFSGQGGFGFEGKLPQSDYITGTVNTGVDGLAFINMNISKAGRFRVFWKVNTTANVGEVDTADFSTATDIDVKSFKAYGDPSYNIPLAKVTLFYQNNNPPVWNAMPPPGSQYGSYYVYNGTVQEIGANDFVRDGRIDKWYIVYSPNATSTSGNITTGSGNWWGALRIDDDADFTSNQDQQVTNNYTVSTINFLNLTFDIQEGFGASQGQSIAVAAYNLNNQTSASDATNNVTFVFFQEQPTNTQNGFIMNVQNATQNVTVRVCTETYDKPNSRPLAGATVTELFVNDWNMMGQTKKQLQIYDLMNDSAVGSVQTGPNGCIAVKVGPKIGDINYLSEWTRGQTVWIQGTVQNNTNTESFFAGGVWRNW